MPIQMKRWLIQVTEEQHAYPSINFILNSNGMISSLDEDFPDVICDIEEFCESLKIAMKMRLQQSSNTTPEPFKEPDEPLPC